MTTRRSRVLVIGLDSASPELVLGRWLKELPVLSGLVQCATYGRLHSTHPPITVPAWVSMMTGRDPGQLGMYGFRARRDRGYGPATLLDARDLRAPALWDWVGEAGECSVVVGFPLSYPVPRIRGALVAGMLTPSRTECFTWPASLGPEVRRWAPGYRFDAEAHRSGDLDGLVAETFEMTRARFCVTRELLRRDPWAFGFVHEIGLDRLQHALWDTLEDSGSSGCKTLLDYHRLLDAEIGETLLTVPEETVVLVVSDHGMQRLEGIFALNQWLLQEGYLVLSGPISPGDRLDPKRVDWTRTRAWADGGYCGRIYLNVEGREPEGAVARSHFERVRDELREKLEQLDGPEGQPLGNAVYTPEEVYACREGVPPDLLLYPGDLRYRCVETLGEGDLFPAQSNAFRDEANHAWEGLFILRDPERPASGRIDRAHLLDVAGTLLERLGLPVPHELPAGRLQPRDIAPWSS